MSPSRSTARRARPALLAWLAVMLASPALPAGDPAPRDHAIFVGLDVTIGFKGKYYSVVGAGKDGVRIILDQKETVIPTVLVRDIHFKRGVKLSNLNARIENLHGVKGRNRALAASEAEARRTNMAMQGMAQDQIDSAASNIGYVTGISDPGADGSEANLGAEVTAQTVAPLTEASHSLTRLAQAGNDMPPDEFVGDLSNTGFIVTFDVSASIPLTECHVAIIASYSLPGGTNQLFNKVSLRPVGLLEANTRKITCEVQGFPSGAELKGYRVALYSNGQEVATNLSARRTNVTRDEAVLFLTTDYLSRHQGETLPPAPMLMVPRFEFVSSLGPTPLDQVIYARVAKDGKIVRLSTDPVGRSRLPSELSAVADQIAFIPALEKGKPVEGVARFKLADLVAAN